MTSLLQKGKDKVKTLYSENVYYSQDWTLTVVQIREIWKCMYLSTGFKVKYTFIKWLWRYSAIVCLKSSTVSIVLENQELFALEW